MTYVEWLRVRNVLRVVAIVLAALILVFLVLRISLNRYMNDQAIINHIKTQPGTTISQSILPDGTHRMTINDPSEDTTATINDLGRGGRRIVIDEPKSKSTDKIGHVMMGSVDVHSEEHGSRRVVVIDTNSSVPFAFYMIAADLMAFIVTTFLAAPFARENDGHLEIALTKPASRTVLGLSTMAVDLAGILLASAMTVVTLIICQFMFEVPSFDFSGANWQFILMGIIFPFAWYAMLAASTASMKRGYGAVLGFAWPAALLITFFGIAHWGDSILGQLMHQVFWTLSRAIPLSYLDAHISFNQTTGALQPNGNFGLRLAIEFALFVIYSALAVFQWKRVEA